ncbi:GGDEF domain-containing protein [Dyella acidiphila]|uniref:diguanylate cyclase n=1 Tax=Dyella acidiphila TaxID=2775866 RepID=A0ABR9GF52_9GAMM|nr:diguanylate cyclase [Dyella acidiphila]MBE1162674.1 GGDEF domain-containing protein [Dyella acidiphila]
MPKAIAAPLTVLLATAFVLLHGAMISFAGIHAIAASYTFLIAAPLLALAAVIWRGKIEGFGLSRGWSLLAASLVLWTAGMVISMQEDLFFANSNAAPGGSMLFYVLYGVPIFYAVATVGGDAGSRLQRVIDAVLVITLGYLYFAMMFSWVSLQGAANPMAAHVIADMFDMENAFLAFTTAIRFLSSDTVARRHFFGVLTAFTSTYALVAAYYNHHVALDVAQNIGSHYDLVADAPFLLLMALAWLGPSRLSRGLNPPLGLVRFVRSGSPLLLALAVLVIAILLLRQQFTLGVAGVIIAVLGYGLRSILSQVQQIETADVLRRDRRMFAEMALRDGLTGVPNRRAFEEALEREWRLALRSQQAISLLLADIDLFKQYNDRYGHLAGDACLREVASVLQQALKRPADMLARYGGEEFVLVLPNTPGAGAGNVAMRLCKQLSRLQLPHDDSPTRYVTISIGVACVVPTEGAQPNDLISAADRALYAAKRNGRNRVERTV